MVFESVAQMIDALKPAVVVTTMTFFGAALAAVANRPATASTDNRMVRRIMVIRI